MAERYYVIYYWVAGFPGEPLEDSFSTLGEAIDEARHMVETPVVRLHGKKVHAEGAVVERMGDREKLAYAVWREQHGAVRETRSEDHIRGVEELLDRRCR